jgi:hypothetical protein
MRYRVLGFEKHPIAGTDFTKAEAGEVVGILLEPICDCSDCTTEVATQTDLAGEQGEGSGCGKDE